MLAQILLPLHFSPFQNVPASCERSINNKADKNSIFVVHKSEERKSRTILVRFMTVTHLINVVLHMLWILGQKYITIFLGLLKQ